MLFEIMYRDMYVPLAGVAKIGGHIFRDMFYGPKQSDNFIQTCVLGP